MTRSRIDSLPTINRRSFLAALGALGLAALAEGCPRSNSGGGTTNGGGGGAQKGVLRYAMMAEPTTFDPALVQDGPTIDILQNIFEGMVGWNEKGEIVPLAAKELPTLSPDHKTYTFTLRDGLKFHNGRAVTAEDVVYSITRALDANLASPVAMDYLDDIAGAVEYHTGKAATVSGLKAVDAKTVAITITAPRAYFLGKFTYGTAYIVAKEEVAKGEKSAKGGAPFIGATTAIGTGPFKLASYTRQGKVVLDANPDYWGGKPKLDHIERPIILDAKTARDLYDSGELDYLDEPRGSYESDRNDPALKDQLYTYPRSATWYVGLNQGEYPPFKDARVRQAIAHAIDKKAIVDSVLLGVNDVAGGFVPEGIFSYDASYKGLEHDPEKAKKLLADAGFPNGTGLPPLTISFREQIPEIRKTCEVLKEQLSAIGVNISLNEMEWLAFLNQNTANKSMAFHMRWSADYLDPQDFLSLFLSSKGAENHTGYHNPEVDKLCAQADGESDQAKRTALYQQIDKITTGDAPIIPIYYQKDIELRKPYVTGIRDSLFGHLPHTTTSVG